MSTTSLGNRFAGLFADAAARAKLARLTSRTRVPTFNLATSSLRHIPKWLDRLETIHNGNVLPHGNFVSDPTSAGLVNDSTSPPTLTPAGSQFFSHKTSLYTQPARAEYELVKALYFGGHTHSPRAQAFLDSKRANLLTLLNQFKTPRRIFLTQPRLLAIAELVSGFPGALGNLQNLTDAELTDFIKLSESQFAALCSGAGHPAGLSHLCGRIGSEFTRASERRIHYLLSMALLNIASTVPAGAKIPLVVPAPFSNLLTGQDILGFSPQYTSDIIVSVNGTNYFVEKPPPAIGLPAPSAAPVAAVTPPIQTRSIKPLTHTPSGSGGTVPATHKSRNRRRAAQQPSTTLVIDLNASERAEDYAETNVLSPKYGTRLRRAGHRAGENMALPDGMVPGADFYVVDAADSPVEFIEIKTISGTRPANIQLTRAEYLRACRCVAAGIPYRLILVDAAAGQWHEIAGFAQNLAALRLSEVPQFSVNLT